MSSHIRTPITTPTPSAPRPATTSESTSESAGPVTGAMPRRPVGSPGPSGSSAREGRHPRWILGQPPPDPVWRAEVARVGAVTHAALGDRAHSPSQPGRFAPLRAHLDALRERVSDLPPLHAACVEFAVLRSLAQGLADHATVTDPFAARQSPRLAGPRTPRRMNLPGGSGEAVGGPLTLHTPTPLACAATPWWVGAAQNLVTVHEWLSTPTRAEVTAVLDLQRTLLATSLVPPLAADALLVAFTTSTSADGPLHWFTWVEGLDSTGAVAEDAPDAEREGAGWSDAVLRVTEELASDPHSWSWWTPVRRADTAQDAVRFAARFAELLATVDQLRGPLPAAVLSAAHAQIRTQLVVCSAVATELGLPPVPPDAPPDPAGVPGEVTARRWDAAGHRLPPLPRALRRSLG